MIYNLECVCVCVCVCIYIYISVSGHKMNKRYQFTIAQITTHYTGPNVYQHRFKQVRHKSKHTFINQKIKQHA